MNKYWSTILTRLSAVAFLIWLIIQLARPLIYRDVGKDLPAETKWVFVIVICIAAGGIVVAALWQYLPIQRYLPKHLKSGQRPTYTYPFRF